MFEELIEKMGDTAKTKIGMLRGNWVKYFLSAMLAGIFVGFGIILIFSIGAPLKEMNDAALKALMGASFGVALTLVIFTGTELFTGNNMIMTIGNLEKKVTWIDTSLIWIVSFFGNLAGSLFLAWGMSLSGLIAKGAPNAIITAVAAMKMSTSFTELFVRGILCNMLVCLAIWTAARTKEDIAKLVLIFWCLFAFIGSGFEHSIANMTLLGMALFSPHDPAVISWMGFVNNLVPVTLGNIVGGALFIGAVNWYIFAGKKAK